MPNLTIHQTSAALTNNVYHDGQGNTVYKVHTPSKMSNRITTITKTIRRNSDEPGSSQKYSTELKYSEIPKSFNGMSSEDLDKAGGSKEDDDDVAVGWDEEDEQDELPELLQNDSETFMYLAQIQWKLFKSSRFRFGDGKEVQAKDFFRKKGMGFYGRHKVFTASDGKEYIWKSQDYFPELYLNDGSKTPIAIFRPPKRDRLFSKAAPGYLEIYPEGQHMIDEIFVTFIYIEKLRKDNETAARSNGTIV